MNASRQPRLFWLACLALAIGASACGKSAAPSAPKSSSALQPSRQAADDIARQFATSLSRQGLPLNQVGSTSLADVARGGVSPATLGRAGVPMTQGDANLSWSLVFTFYDAAGNPQQVYDPETTARIVVHAKVRGTLTSPEHRAFIGSDRLLDVAGVLPTETTIEVDGSARDTADFSFDATNGSSSRHYHLLGAGDLTDMRQLKDKSVNPYPLSGTARWAIVVDASSRDANGTKEAHYEATVLVTFNGTRYPTIEVTKNFRYQMDLDTGEVEPLPA
jgi:hypothetical protein